MAVRWYPRFSLFILVKEEVYNANYHQLLIPQKPYSSDEDLRDGIAEAYCQAGFNLYPPSMVKQMLHPCSTSVFTHCDLALRYTFLLFYFSHLVITVIRNILVEGKIITGIVDWEFSGWYPIYWEFIAAMGPAMDCGDYIKWVPEFLEPNWQALVGMITHVQAIHFLVIKSLLL
jgi:hypothetical protein